MVISSFLEILTRVPRLGLLMISLAEHVDSAESFLAVYI